MVLLPLAVAFIINTLLNRYLDNERLRGKVHLIFYKLLFSLALWGVAIALALGALPGISRTWETIIAGSGILAVVIGLAAQSTLANVFAGIAMSTRASRPFDIGDRIKVGDAEPGFVKDITLRHVVLVTYLNSTIYIPNSVAGASLVTNFTTQDACGYPIEITVGYSDRIEEAMSIMQDVILHHPKHYGTDNVTILCKECGTNGVTLKGVVTTEDFLDNARACSDCLLETVKRFRAAGIEIPYNKVEVISDAARAANETPSA